MTMPAYIPDKEELRAKLSLHYVCSKLGIVLNRDDRAVCPFHADSDPSFYLWDGDDGNTRWHCQPCAIGGDIFDLIKKVEGLTFNESLARAAELLAELPADYTPPPRPATVRANPDDFAAEVQAARTLAASPGHAGILALRSGLARQEEGDRVAQVWDEHLREWGWGIGTDGNVYMPHWTSDHRLTGCKLRLRDGSKQSIPGSRYEALYGAWRPRQHKSILITEGETDAVYASWLAKKEGIGIDVYSLPSGANKPVDVQFLDFLRGANPLYLAFDPDDAGVDATRRWFQSFVDIGFSKIRVCCLPLGRDLREAQPVLSDLLEQSREPFPPPENIAAGPSGYVRTDRSNNLYLATNWTVDPVAQLAGDGETGYDAVLFAAGREKKVVIRLADLASSQALNKWANSHARTFTGTDADRVAITKLVEHRGCVTPEVFQTDRVGMHYPPEQYRFAGPSVVLPTAYLGHLPWRYAPTGKGAGDVSDRILLPAADTFRWRNLEAFLKLSDPSVMHPILAWLCAAARRPEVREFPLLFVGGSSGVGKSTLARLATRLLGSTVEIDLGTHTPFTMLRILSSSTSLPVFVDEWTRLSRPDTLQAFQGSIPLLYTGGMAERGQSDLSTIQYRMTTPTIVAGEDTFALDRELQRTVRVYPTHAAQNHRALDYLHDQPIEAFGQILHHWLAGGPELPAFPDTAPTRDEYNRLILETGWATLLALLTDQAGHNQSVPDLPLLPDLSCLDRPEDDEQDENVYVTALTEASTMYDHDGIPVCWADSEGRGTWVRFVALVGLLESRRSDIQLPGRSRAMRAYFTERYGALKPSLTTPPLSMKTVRANLIPGLNLNHEEVPDAP